MRRVLTIALVLVLFASPVGGEEEQSAAVLLDVDSAIGPATTDYIVRGLEHAEQRGAELVVLRMNTPGGLDSAMRDIIEAILASSVPVASYVAPSGARAASAGTYILYASHIAAMAPATTLGAATPVKMGGQGGGSATLGAVLLGSQDSSAGAASEPDTSASGANSAEGTEQPAAADDNQQQPGAMERKMVEDAASYIRGLAELRGRNAEWAEKAVRESVSASASEALELNVIDFLAADIATLLDKADGRVVKLPLGERELDSSALPLEVYEPDWRNQLLSVLTNPNVAYILMLIGIYGIIFELMNPGSLVPGVVGGVSLLLAMYAFQALPITYAGLALMGLGIAFMIAEAFMPSFGILGIGGAVAFVLGSIMLMDTDVQGFEISIGVIAGFTVASLIIVIGIAAMAARAWKRPRLGGAEQMINAEAQADEDFSGNGHVRYAGERWRAECSQAVSKGQHVRIVSKDGLTLQVEPYE